MPTTANGRARVAEGVRDGERQGGGSMLTVNDGHWRNSWMRVRGNGAGMVVQLEHVKSSQEFCHTLCIDTPGIVEEG